MPREIKKRRNNTREKKPNEETQNNGFKCRYFALRFSRLFVLVFVNLRQFVRRNLLFRLFAKRFFALRFFFISSVLSFHRAITTDRKTEKTK